MPNNGTLSRITKILLWDAIQFFFSYFHLINSVLLLTLFHKFTNSQIHTHTHTSTHARIQTPSKCKSNTNTHSHTLSIVQGETKKKQELQTAEENATKHFDVLMFDYFCCCWWIFGLNPFIRSHTRIFIGKVMRYRHDQ